MGDFFAVLLNLGSFLLIIFIISRFFHHFHNTKMKLTEMEKKLDDIKELLSQK